MTETEQRPPAAAAGPQQAGRPTHWRVPDGLDPMGEVQGSALLRPHFLLRRVDGQVVQVSELLHAVVAEIDPERSESQIADAVSDRYGRRLTVEGLRHLVETRLVPLGLVEDRDRPQPTEAPTARPLLSLSLRGTLLPTVVVRAVASALSPLYLPAVVLAALAGWVAMVVVLVLRADLLVALQDVLATPATLLVLYALLTVGVVVHELGHATACWYGGALPGRIGFGVYLVFPAFYTDVTESYRLGRASRVRTDLGGLYFNVLAVLVLGGGYLLTGSGLLLLAVLVTHIGMVQQLIPVVRFDGYWVLSDLIGVPDLFARVWPALNSVLPGRKVDQDVAELTPIARRLVLAWVLTVVPTLTLALGWLVWTLPVMVTETVRAARVQIDQLSAAWARADVAVILLSCLALVLLVLPLLGVTVLLSRLVVAVGHGGRRLLTGRTGSSSLLMEATMNPHLLTAAAFTDERLLPAEPDVATLGWQHAVYRLSGHTVRLRPGPEERRRAARAAALRTPIHGTRRVVVMSRKGGVGKTTTTLALGSILATERGDRVVAVDANPDAGNLAHRVAPPNDLTITDVLRDLDHIDSYADLKRYTSQAPESRLEVLASDDDSRIGAALDRQDYHRLIGMLDRFYNAILLDTGTGILDSANQGLIAEADELVLVLRAGVDGGRAAALTLDWLQRHGHESLVREAVVVINAVRPGVGAPIGPVRAHFEQRCRAVVTVPWDPALETGARTMLSNLSGATRESLMDLAAAVAQNFTARGAGR